MSDQNNLHLHDQLSAIEQAQSRTAVATLAAALVQTRNLTDVKDIVQAVRDATFILSSDRNNSRYKVWAEEHGIK